MLLKVAYLVSLMVIPLQCTDNHHPQVYESIDEPPPRPEVVKPVIGPHNVPSFNYQAAIQQNKLQFKYFQQQQADAINHAKRHERLKIIKTEPSVQTKPPVELQIKPNEHVQTHVKTSITHPIVKTNNKGFIHTETIGKEPYKFIVDQPTFHLGSVKQHAINTQKIIETPHHQIKGAKQSNKISKLIQPYSRKTAANLHIRHVKSIDENDKFDETEPTVSDIEILRTKVEREPKNIQELEEEKEILKETVRNNLEILKKSSTAASRTLKTFDEDFTQQDLNEESSKKIEVIVKPPSGLNTTKKDYKIKISIQKNTDDDNAKSETIILPNKITQVDDKVSNTKDDKVDKRHVDTSNTTQAQDRYDRIHVTRYVTPSSLNYHDIEDDKVHLKALNSLLGKHPSIQLHGLHQLLGNRPKYYPHGDHKPIQENVRDIPNLQTKPNIKIEIKPEGLHTEVFTQAPVTQPQHNVLQIPQVHQQNLPQVPHSYLVPATHIKPPPYVNSYGLPIKPSGFNHGYLHGPALTSNNDLAKLQAQLNAQAQQEAHLAIQKAKEDAARQVAAQHKALAENQAKAQAYYIAQAQKTNEYHVPQQYSTPIKSQNQYEPYQEPSALLQGHIEEEFSKQPSLEYVHNPQESFHKPDGGSVIKVTSYAHEDVEEDPKQYVVKNEDLNQYVAKNQETPSYYESTDNDDDLQYASKYAFGYRIRDYHSTNDFGHEETRNGDDAKGRYHVLLPDGRTQTVEYYTDAKGYHAKVSYKKTEA